MGGNQNTEGGNLYTEKPQSAWGGGLFHSLCEVTGLTTEPSQIYSIHSVHTRASLHVAVHDQHLQYNKTGRQMGEIKVHMLCFVIYATVHRPDFATEAVLVKFMTLVALNESLGLFIQV